MTPQELKEQAKKLLAEGKKKEADRLFREAKELERKLIDEANQSRN